MPIYSAAACCVYEARGSPSAPEHPHQVVGRLVRPLPTPTLHFPFQSLSFWDGAEECKTGKAVQWNVVAPGAGFTAAYCHDVISILTASPSGSGRTHHQWTQHSHSTKRPLAVSNPGQEGSRCTLSLQLLPAGWVALNPCRHAHARRFSAEAGNHSAPFPTVCPDQSPESKSPSSNQPDQPPEALASPAVVIPSPPVFLRNLLPPSRSSAQPPLHSLHGSLTFLPTCVGGSPSVLLASVALVSLPLTVAALG